MFIIIPHSIIFRSNARGVAPKLVRCEECGYEYVYLLESVVTAEARSVLGIDMDGAERTAENNARTGVQRELAREFGVVPCSECGHVQDHMIPFARRDHRLWMKRVGFLVLIIAFLLLLPLAILRTGVPVGFDYLWPARILWSVFVAAALLGGTLWGLRLAFASTYNPNHADVEIRMQAGRDGSVSKEEYLRCLPRSERSDDEQARRAGPVDDRIFRGDRH